MLSEFSQRFMSYIETRCAAKPDTVEFYSKNVDLLLKNPAMADARLGRIDDALIERFVQKRRRQLTPARVAEKERQRQIAPATVNRTLPTSRRALRMAQEWRLIDRAPPIRLLPGEHNRESVLSHGLEPVYLAATPQPLHDGTLLILDAGLRVAEAPNRKWSDVRLEPVGVAKYGYLHIRHGKSKHAKRNLRLNGKVGTFSLHRSPWSGLSSG